MYKHWDWQTQTPYDNCSWWIPPYSLQWRKWQRRGLYLASVVIFYDGDDDDDVIFMIFLQKHFNRVWLLEHKPSCFWSDCWRAGSEPDAQQTLSGICSMNQVSGQEPNCIANLIRYLGIRYHSLVALLFENLVPLLVSQVYLQSCSSRGCAMCGATLLNK